MSLLVTPARLHGTRGFFFVRDDGREEIRRRAGLRIDGTNDEIQVVLSTSRVGIHEIQSEILRGATSVSVSHATRMYVCVYVYGESISFPLTGKRKIWGKAARAESQVL